MQPLDSTTVRRTARPVTVLQMGGGNFLRGFVDWMIHVADEAGVMDAGVAVVHVTDRPDPAFELLRAQDGLFHVTLEGIKDGQPVREITRVECVQEVVAAHTEFERYRDLYLGADLRVLVSNTTEAGIVWVEDDDITARPPASFPLKVTALLHDRFEHFGGDPAKGLAIVPCELIEDNGSTLREYVLRHAAAAGLSEEFQQWVRECCTFSDTLVDRIVPGFPRDDIARIQAETGFDDQVVVKGEYFHVWAISGGEAVREVLPLDKAGLDVRFMEDIAPFRAQKVRVLNGSHTALSAVGLQLGHESVREAFEDPTVRRFVDELVADEVLPTIDGEPEVLREFAAGILERFGNPFLHHRLADIALNAVSKWRTRNLPVYVDRVRAGESAQLTVLSLAAVLLLQSGAAAVPGFVPVDDAGALALLAGGPGAGGDGGAGDGADEAAVWVGRAVRGLDLAAGLDPVEADVLIARTAEMVESLTTEGARATLARVLAETTVG